MDTNRIIKGPDIDFCEFLQFIGIWVLMTENPGTNQAGYFSGNPIDIFSVCSIRVNHFLSVNRFENICSPLKFNATSPPSFRGKFYELRSMIVACNGHMQKAFIPSWISCLDE